MEGSPMDESQWGVILELDLEKSSLFESSAEFRAEVESFAHEMFTLTKKPTLVRGEGNGKILYTFPDAVRCSN